MRGTRIRLAAAKTGGERFYIISILHIPSTKGDISPCARLTNCKYHIREGVLSDQAELLMFTKSQPRHTAPRPRRLGWKRENVENSFWRKYYFVCAGARLVG